MIEETEGFGAPKEFGKRHFFVEIPNTANDAVKIFEDLGIDEERPNGEYLVCHLTLPRNLWAQIKDDARRDFNTRLKAKKLKVGNWVTGKTKLDRFLGRELCVLAWAAELARIEECPIICQRWLALRPEERWWLYSKTASEAGNDGESERGWRKALYCALSDGINMPIPKNHVQKKSRAKNTAEPDFALLNLLPSSEKGNI